MSLTLSFTHGAKRVKANMFVIRVVLPLALLIPLRRPDPHWYPEGIVRGLRVTDMTDEQVADYYRGYEQEEDRKEWE